MRRNLSDTMSTDTALAEHIARRVLSAREESLADCVRELMVLFDVDSSDAPVSFGKHCDIQPGPLVAGFLIVAAVNANQTGRHDLGRKMLGWLNREFNVKLTFGTDHLPREGT